MVYSVILGNTEIRHDRTKFLPYCRYSSRLPLFYNYMAIMHVVMYYFFFEDNQTIFYLQISGIYLTLGALFII